MKANNLSELTFGGNRFSKNERSILVILAALVLTVSPYLV